MLTKLYRWFENLWNLRKIFDKYLPQIRELVETVKKLQQQITELKALKEELENGILLLKQSNSPDLQDTEELSPIPSKVSEWYDSEGNGGWDAIINPDK